MLSIMVKMYKQRCMLRGINLRQSNQADNTHGGGLRAMTNKQKNQLRVWNKVPEEVPSFLESPKFPYKIVWDKTRVASVPKTSSIHSVSTEQWTVTDSHWITEYTMLA